MQVELRHCSARDRITFVLVTTTSYERLRHVRPDLRNDVSTARSPRSPNPRKSTQNPATLRFAGFPRRHEFPKTSRKAFVSGKLIHRPACQHRRQSTGSSGEQGESPTRQPPSSASDPNAAHVLGRRGRRSDDPRQGGLTATTLVEVKFAGSGHEGQNQNLSIVETNDFGAERTFRPARNIRIYYDRTPSIISKAEQQQRSPATRVDPGIKAWTFGELGFTASHPETEKKRRNPRLFLCVIWVVKRSVSGFWIFLGILPIISASVPTGNRRLEQGLSNKRPQTSP